MSVNTATDIALLAVKKKGSSAQKSRAVNKKEDEDGQLCRKSRTGEEEEEQEQEEEEQSWFWWGDVDIFGGLSSHTYEYDTYLCGLMGRPEKKPQFFLK